MFYKYGYIISVTLLTVNTFFEKIFADEGQMDRKPSGPAEEPSACTKKRRMEDLLRPSSVGIYTGKTIAGTSRRP